MADAVVVVVLERKCPSEFTGVEISRVIGVAPHEEQVFSSGDHSFKNFFYHSLSTICISRT